MSFVRLSRMKEEVQAMEETLVMALEIGAHIDRTLQEAQSTFERKRAQLMRHHAHVEEMGRREAAAKESQRQLRRQEQSLSQSIFQMHSSMSAGAAHAAAVTPRPQHLSMKAVGARTCESEAAASRHRRRRSVRAQQQRAGRSDAAASQYM